jgi:hypothetical protein
MNLGYCRYGHSILTRARCRYGHEYDPTRQVRDQAERGRTEPQEGR